MNSKTLYWISTAIFAGFMIFTAVPDVLMVPEAVTFMKHLGYPEYLIPFIGWAKIAGSIALLIPGWPRVKEWAYAGLFFDLVGAFYSVMIVDGLNPGHLFMLFPLGFLFLSYRLWHRKRIVMEADPQTI